MIWKNQSGSIVSSGLSNSSSLPGDDTYYLEVTDNVGCKAGLSHFISQPEELISAVITHNDVSCFGGDDGTATVAAVGGTLPYQYIWSNGTSDFQATGLTQGTYQVTVTDFNGCNPVVPASVLINQPDDIIGVSTIADVSCFGGSDGTIAYTATGGTNLIQYQWNGGVGSSGGMASNLFAGVYTVTLSDQLGCTASYTDTISEPLQLVATINSVDAYCTDFNGEISITGVAGGSLPYSYTWSNSNNTESTATGLYPGGYTATVTDNNGCWVPLTITVADQPGPIITGISVTEPLCFEDCNGSLTAVVQGGTLPLLPKWDDLLLQSTLEATNLCAGDYCVTVTDNNGCVSASCVELTEPSLFEVDVNASTVNACEGETIQLWAGPTGGTWPYPQDASKAVWNDASIPTEYGPHNIIPEQGLTSIYSVTLTDGRGCQANDQIAIIVSPALSIFAPDSTIICEGSTANACFSGSGGRDTSDYIFTWEYDQHTESAVIQTCDELSPNTTTWYYVTLNDGCSTPITDSTKVVVNPTPTGQFSAPIQEGCAPLEVFFSGSTTSDFLTATFHWDFQNDGFFDSEFQQFATWSFDTSGSYTVSMKIISEDGCEVITTIPDFIEVYPSPEVEFAKNPDSTTLVNPLVRVDAGMTQGADQIHWTFEDENNPATSQDIVTTHLYSDTGSYLIILDAVNELGCTAADTQVFVIKPGFTMYAPTAFTPDDDGKNDVFMLKGVGVSKFHLFIYDRFGSEIYETKSMEQGWDGTLGTRGRLAPGGTYVWKAFITPMNREDIEEMVGIVTLIR